MFKLLATDPFVRTKSQEEDVRWMKTWGSAGVGMRGVGSGVQPAELPPPDPRRFLLEHENFGPTEELPLVQACRALAPSPATATVAGGLKVSGERGFSGPRRDSRFRAETPGT